MCFVRAFKFTCACWLVRFWIVLFAKWIWDRTDSSRLLMTEMMSVLNVHVSIVSEQWWKTLIHQSRVAVDCLSFYVHELIVNCSTIRSLFTRNLWKALCNIVKATKVVTYVAKKTMQCLVSFISNDWQDRQERKRYVQRDVNMIVYYARASTVFDKQINLCDCARRKGGKLTNTTIDTWYHPMW